MDLINIKDIKVYDPDTFKASIVGSGRFSEILTNADFRVKGINTPERRTKSELEKLLELKGRNRLFDLINKSKKVQIDLDGKMSFGRFHTDLFIDGISWSEIVINEKLGVSYNGEYAVKDFNWNDFVIEHHSDLIK